jgi:hypothetical protein
VTESSGARYTLDALAGLTAFAAMAKILPPIAAALSIIWLVIQLVEWGWNKAKRFR